MSNILYYTNTINTRHYRDNGNVYTGTTTACWNILQWTSMS